MLVLATAKPWNYWLAYLLVLGAALLIVGLAVGYVIKVVAAKYPRQQQ